MVVILLLSASSVQGDCRECYLGLVRCANELACTDSYKIAVPKMVQLIRQDCPIENGGPCPRTACRGESQACPPCDRRLPAISSSPDDCKPCPVVTPTPCQPTTCGPCQCPEETTTVCPQFTCEPCRCPATTTTVCPSITCKPCVCPTTTTTPCPSSTCRPCQCPSCKVRPVIQCPAPAPCSTPSCDEELKECRLDLLFTNASKIGAQTSRDECETKLSNKNTDLTTAQDNASWYVNKSIDLTDSLNTCNLGYTLANDSIKFLTNLVNEKSGKYNLCVESFNETESALENEKGLLKDCQTLTSSQQTQISDVQTQIRTLDGDLKNCSSFGRRFENRIKHLASKLNGNILFLDFNFGKVSLFNILILT